MTTVHIVNAFTKDGLGGNGAGVVMDARGLSDSQKLAIAARVGLSETAFVEPSDKADFRISFWTPAAEVDLCGHATIATFWWLHASGRIAPGTYTQETRAGVLPVEVGADGRAMMMQNPPVFSDRPDTDDIAASLGIPANALGPSMPVQVVSTGLRDVIVPVRSLAVLHAIRPDFERVSRISRLHDTVGYHVFALETVGGATAHCRNFAPLYDIPEEAATGTSSGALACYLREYSPIHASREAFAFEQWYSLDSPSEIFVRFDADTAPWVWGRAMLLSEEELDV